MGQMLFLLPNQQRQSTEGSNCIGTNMNANYCWLSCALFIVAIPSSVLGMGKSCATSQTCCFPSCQWRIITGTFADHFRCPKLSRVGICMFELSADSTWYCRAKLWAFYCSCWLCLWCLQNVFIVFILAKLVSASCCLVCKFYWILYS